MQEWCNRYYMSEVIRNPTYLLLLISAEPPQGR
jgi:hypothetical protein